MKRMIRSSTSRKVNASEDFVVDYDLNKLDWEEEERKRIARELADEEDAYDLEHGEGIYSSEKVTATSTRDRISDLEERIAEVEAKIKRLRQMGADDEEIIDAQLYLEELEDELNFAWQDDEAEYNYAVEQQEFNPDGSLKWY